MPKLSTKLWSDHLGGANPISGQNDGPYSTIALGDQIELSQFGVHLERLPPGSRSSHRHWHQNEDEFLYLISGELILIEDQETVLRAGEAAGWKAGQPLAHCLENRSDTDAVMLLVGTRKATDIVHYPDHDRIMYRTEATRRFTRSDGTPVPQDD